MLRLISKVKLKIDNLIQNNFIDLIESIELHPLNYMIDSKYAIKYFDLFLLISFLNQKTNFRLYKFLVKFLIWKLSILGLLKCVALQLDSIDNHKLCVYLGDISILFPSLRKFTLFSIICAVVLAMSTLIVFNFNHHNQWYVIFECFQKKSSPKTGGFKSKWILIRMFILTKIIFYILIIVVACLTETTWLIGAHILIKKFYKEPIRIYEFWKLLNFYLLKIPIDELIAWLV